MRKKMREPKNEARDIKRSTVSEEEKGILP